MMFTQRTVRIRKPRPCDWCGEIMEKGDEAETWTFVDGGQIGRVTVHGPCGDAIDDLCEPDDIIYPGIGKRPRRNGEPCEYADADN